MKGVHKLECASVVHGGRDFEEECDCGTNAELLTIATGLGTVAGRAEKGEPVDPNRLVGYAQRLEHLVTGGRKKAERERRG